MRKRKTRKNRNQVHLLPADLTNVRNCSDNVSFPYADGNLVTYIFFANKTYSFMAPTSIRNKRIIKEAIETSSENNQDVLAIWKGQWRTDIFIVDDPSLAISKL